MRIVEAVIHDVELPLVHSFETSSHRKSSLRHLLVQLTDESGTTGWGEIASPAGPYYAAETTTMAWHTATEYLLPAVLGKEWEHPEQINGFFAAVRGHWFAKAGVDMAAWTLFAARSGQPLAQTLGGTRQSVVAGVSLGIEPSIDELLEQVAKHVDSGYPRVKLKIAPSGPNGRSWDVEPVKAVRDAYPDLDVHVDANGAYPGRDQAGYDDALAALRALDQYGLTMIEQPFAPRNFLDSARLQAELDTPVCLDESVETLDDLRTALELAAGGVLNIKVSRMGGLSAARAAHDLAQQAGWPVWCGGMHEFGIGRLANVAISSLPGFTLPSDVSASNKYYAQDVITPPVTAENGVVQVPEAPGLGAEVRTELIAAHATQVRTFTA
ncbi:o-succinylbenzoate synthase [Nesterenkonia alkaliphila]|uniref:o-succinylbenzoate synthase n=1 Tax=Nesterenkonia alkaliphila TaxID=1463631 RepID=A0A7K1UK75_9MICC|nr:o-succinylbenzoate synthase [Nesterenkonia alkaliphila]MVT26826.1 o-succinylbenzoate synthase [Nesterenkonia alkaliphila]GFZ81728.1 o-succinylbenzoate synthase [Nesterenkonia alkaliphila]